MHTLNKNVYLFAMCLSALAGFVDAVGFLYLGGYFISFMSGNSTRLAVGITSEGSANVELLGIILLLFITGVVLGTLLRHFARKLRPAVMVLMLLTFLLSGAALSCEIGWNAFGVALMVLAMGCENAVFQRDGDVVVGLTYMTGTLVKAGQRMANALLGGPKFAWVPYLLLWTGLVLGGATGALLYSAFGLQSLWAASLWAATLTAVANIYRDRLGF